MQINLRQSLRAIVLAGVGGALLLPSATALASGIGITNTELISASPSGEPSNSAAYGSIAPKMSKDGRYVTFWSASTNLTNDTINNYQAFVYDRETKQMDIASRSNTGEVANSHTTAQEISGNGRYVMFDSSATNLGGSSAGSAYIRDLATKTTTSLTSPSALGSTIGSRSISDDGVKIIYKDLVQVGSQSNGYSWLYSTYIYDQTTRTRTALPNATNIEVSEATDSISGNGKLATYTVYKRSRLGVNEQRDMYVYNLQTKSSTLLSNKAERGAIFSSDASHVYFWEKDIFVANGRDNYRWNLYDHDTTQNTRTLLDSFDYNEGGPACLPSVSDNRRFMTYCETYGSLYYKDLNSGEKLTVNNFNTAANLDSTGTQLVYDKSGGYDTYDSQVYVSKIGAPDTTPPTISDFTWQTNPKTIGQSSSVSVGVSDDISGVASGEYYLGDNDPGQGNGAAMALSNGSLSVTIGTDYPSGVYKFNVRAKDNAGNWSEPKADYLVVYDPSSPLGITGRSGLGITPRLANGDKLPGLVRSNQADTASFGFTADFRNGALNQNNDLQFSYNTGLLCFTPFASNCHRTSVNANAVSWLLFDQDNDSRGRFAGTARVVVDGVTTNNPFSVEGIDGQRLTPQTKDSVVIKVYAPGANVNSAEPLYQASGSLQLSNGVRIR